MRCLFVEEMERRVEKCVWGVGNGKLNDDYFANDAVVTNCKTLRLEKVVHF